jgi:hypothetical protein
MAYEFEKHVWERVLEVVKKESAVQPSIDSCGCEDNNYKKIYHLVQSVA